ncbi:MAG: DNA polymerase III subunit gamma/tau [Gammaproteobacteria bacterium]|nr:DNA polymerase III subunit gamma/tau [Gammaproteobacteria bacterium]MBQ0840206.1 DNA polymerase III subunit gamma/tau [Gammaproteobacteria bacterium]
MSYQVLARKWRPRTFAEMAGQEHVLQALINALDNDRLHHAYLFTGTRGVGKTTIARILAKCLNCEEGVSSIPCGKCSACTEIAAGRFIDLIEVDAASRTKVEDTRELLDNVQYMPSHGRFKVYLIDEVHMLSTHSFNALLKTLEEPPAHVKFLLATTDPQKLPVTILSRCLQFNLKNLSPERIVEHLSFVLGEEKVPCEEAALWALARAADGSMRDALSLTDQAIAHGGGKLSETELSTMLGSIDRSWIIAICQALAERDSAQVLAQVGLLAEHAPDFGAALSEMLSVWHRVAIAQVVPEAADNSLGDQQMITSLATGLSREEVQLYYQICLLGKRDLALAADPRSGFEMVMLRLLAFQPAPQVGMKPLPIAAEPSPAQSVVPPVPKSEAPALNPAPAQSTAPINVDTAPAGEVAESVKKPEALDVAAQALPATPAFEPVPAEAVPPFEARTGEAMTGVASEQKAQPVLKPETAPEADLAPQNEVPQLVEVPQRVEVPQLIEKPKADSPTFQPRATRQSGEVEPSENPAPAIPAPVNEPAMTAASRAPVAAPTTPPARQAAEPAAVLRPNTTNSQPAIAQVSDFPLSSFNNERWLALCHALPISGLLATVAANSVLEENDGQRLLFRLEKGHDAVYDPAYQQRLADALGEYFRQPLVVEIVIGQVTAETPYLYRLRKRAERQALAVQTLRDDPVAKALVQRFDATLCEISVVAIDESAN